MAGCVTRLFNIQRFISCKSLGYFSPLSIRSLGSQATVRSHTGHCTCCSSSPAQLGVRQATVNITTLPTVRLFTQSSIHRSDVAKQAGTEPVEENETEKPPEVESSKLRPVVDVETSIKYMKSKAYKITYGDAHVWQPYRRNHKGSIPPEKTRRTCIRKGVISTGNPCPICRDEYLVLHSENVALLKQFIMPQTGEVLSYQKTGLCQVQHKNLLIALQQAWDLGYIDCVQPFRRYDYTEYYSQSQLKPIREHNTKTTANRK